MAAVAAAASAQSGYPRKPIRMLVSLQAASAVDNAARVVAQRMAENMDQQIVVENQPGAAGLIGTERVVKAVPGGCTIGGFNDSIMTMLPNLHAKMPWDIMKDFDPVSLVVTIEWALVAPATSPFRTAAEVIAAAKAKPGALNYSSGGNGRSSTLTGHSFMRACFSVSRFGTQCVPNCAEPTIAPCCASKARRRFIGTRTKPTPCFSTRHRAPL